MNWLPCVSRRRHKAELAAATAAHEGLLAKADKAYEELKTERDGARTGRDHYIAQHGELTEQLARARAREVRLITTSSDLRDLNYQQADEIVALQKANRQLQARLDDAVGLTTGGIKDSGPWQPAHTEPKPEVAGS